MVPGNQLKKWLNYNGIRVDEKDRNIRMNAEEVGEIANQMVSIIISSLTVSLFLLSRYTSPSQ